MNLEDLEFEMLTKDIIDSNFGDWAKCEDEWVPTTSEILQKGFEIAQRIMPNYKTEYPYLDFNVGIEYLKKGFVIHLPYSYVRLKTDYPKCSKCGASIIDGLYAISRRDNETMICSNCGMKEAFEDLSRERN